MYMNHIIKSSLIIIWILIGSIGCSFSEQTRQLVFKPMMLGKAIDCDAVFMREGKAWHLAQWQFFLSHIETKDSKGNWQPWNMATNANQAKNIALLGEHCGDKSHWQVDFEQAKTLKEIKAIRFSLGVPFEQNHQNPMSQPSPLNIPSMFWVWQTGHKFMRLELSTKQDNWMFHLGSTGCNAASPMRAPQKACVNPNRFNFELTFDGEQHGNEIMFDLAELTQKLALTEQQSCQSEQENPACKQLFKNLTSSDLFSWIAD